MATLIKQLIRPKEAENSQFTQYLAISGVTAIIDKFTATNTTLNNQQFSINLVTSGDSPGDQNLVVDDLTVEPGKTYVFTEVGGQVLEEGGFISTIASASSAITILCSGREITADV